MKRHLFTSANDTSAARGWSKLWWTGLRGRQGGFEVTDSTTYRVVQWATGAVGRQATRMVLDQPHLDHVGCYVTSPAKAGRDLGELVRRSPVGVVATSDIDEICAIDADVVLHMPLPSARAASDPEYDTAMLERLLRSGKNVITIVGYVYPRLTARRWLIGSKRPVSTATSACTAAGFTRALWRSWCRWS